MKRYRVLISIMNAYCQNEFSTYKESIIKELRIYSYKTISNIIDEALMMFRVNLNLMNKYAIMLRGACLTQQCIQRCIL